MSDDGDPGERIGEAAEALGVGKQLEIMKACREAYASGLSTRDELVREHAADGLTVEVLDLWIKRGKWKAMRKRALRKRREARAVAVVADPDVPPPAGGEPAPRRRTESDREVVVGTLPSAPPPPENLVEDVEQEVSTLRLTGAGRDLVEYLGRAARRLQAAEFMVASAVEDVVRRMQAAAKLRETSEPGKPVAIPKDLRVTPAEVQACLAMIQKVDDLAFWQLAARARTENVKETLREHSLPAKTSAPGD